MIQANTDIFRDDMACSLYRKMFCKLYGVSSPVLKLEDISHWRAVVEKLDLSYQGVHKARTLVAGGLFYGISSRVPDTEQIKALIDEGISQSADALLIPVVRNVEDSSVLFAAGFYAFPWFHECVYEVQKTIEDDLLLQVGKSQLKDMLRLKRKAESCYELQILGHEDLKANPHLIFEIDKILGKNVSKYRHVANPYGASTLQWLLETPFAERLKICLRRDKESGDFVQASVSFVDMPSQQMLQLVQGIDHRHVRTGHNLYIAETLQLYQWGIDHGIRFFNLGRGALIMKNRLGANRVYTLVNFILPLKGIDLGELKRLQQEAILSFKNEERMGAVKS